MATKLYNKAILPLEGKIDGEADNLAAFLVSVRDCAHHFNWQRLITVPINDGTTRNLLMHYTQVTLNNTRTHMMTYINMPMRDAQDNDMFYYFIAASLTNDFCMTVLLYANIYTVANVPVTSALLKQIIILTRVDNPASMMHIREMLIESKSKLLLLKSNITEFNQWVRKQMGHLHTQEQESVDLLYYLWKAYKAAPDDEFVIYIKDLKSQCDDGRATFTAEDLMVRAENKYKAQLLDEENTSGKPTEDQEKVMAMTAKINSLKKAYSGTTTTKLAKQKTMGKTEQANKKALPMKMKDQNKKTNDKWAWKSKPPKDTDGKENNAFVKTFEGKKYFWCLNHNNGAGMWTLHHPNDCEAGKAAPSAITNANIAAFDTMDSDSNQERWLHQSQVLTWFWLAITQNIVWWLLPDDVGLMLAAIFMVSGLIIYLILEGIAPQEQQSYIPKKRCWRKSRLFIPILTALNQCATTLTKSISNMKVRCQYHLPRLRYFGHRHKRKKGKFLFYTTLTGMTTTWTKNQTASSGMFDSDSQVLMLDDGASVHHQ